MKVKFVKYQGLGNDFIVFDAREDSFPQDFIERDQKSMISLCDRRFGIGADGIIFALPAQGNAYVRMRIFNSDGSEPESCGNGIRCLAKYVSIIDSLNLSYPLEIETNAGEVSTSFTAEGHITVDMGKPIFIQEEIPTILPMGSSDIPEGLIKVNGLEFHVFAAGMGNPHMVIKVDDLKSINLQQLGPILEKHVYFPSKTNVHFVQVRDRSRVDMLIWERGCGPTLACGTGACATHAVLSKLGHCDTNIKLKLPGGYLSTSWQDFDGSILMTGPATEVFSGNFSLPFD